MRTLQCKKNSQNFFFAHEKLKKTPKKVAQNRPRPLFPTNQPRPQPTAQNWFSISWNFGTRHLFSYLCTQHMLASFPQIGSWGWWKFKLLRIDIVVHWGLLTETYLPPVYLYLISKNQFGKIKFNVHQTWFFQPDFSKFKHSRVWNKSSPLNKSSLWKFWQKE